MTGNCIDPYVMDMALELDILDNREGRSDSTVRVWDKQRGQGRQRRHATAGPVYRSAIKLRKRGLVRPANIISSARPAM